MCMCVYVYESMKMFVCVSVMCLCVCVYDACVCACVDDMVYDGKRSERSSERENNLPSLTGTPCRDKISLGYPA